MEENNMEVSAIAGGAQTQEDELFDFLEDSTVESEAAESEMDGDTPTEIRDREGDEAEGGTDETQEDSEEGGFTLQHNGQLQTISRKEVEELAQKGLNYDELSDKQAALQKYQDETQDVIDTLNTISERSGMAFIQQGQRSD